MSVTRRMVSPAGGAVDGDDLLVHPVGQVGGFQPVHLAETQLADPQGAQGDGKDQQEKGGQRRLRRRDRARARVLCGYMARISFHWFPFHARPRK